MTLHLNITILPALTYLMECAREIATTHGDDRAYEWLGEMLMANRGLFIRIEPGRPRTKLRLIEGGQ